MANGENAYPKKSNPRLIRPAQRVHEQLQALGLDSHLEVIPDPGHAIKEIIGREFMKRMDRMRPGIDS